MPAPLVAPLAALLALACVRAELYRDGMAALNLFPYKDRSVETPGGEVERGCLYLGRWFVEGAPVSTREACLRCACSRGGALACSRRACAATPDPPPRRCHLLHRKGACCPELHCPDGVTLLERTASARLEDDEYSNIATPGSVTQACVEGGAVFGAGSALSSRTACEQCFCLGGARRCVRPRCLPAPPHCRASPAPGACCPHRYYCDRQPTAPPDTHHTHLHDCEVNGQWVPEGERVPAEETSANCTQCFCLRGTVRCQPLACAPALRGCTPLLRAGQCCPHQYRCDHNMHGSPQIAPTNDNALVPARNDDRSFRSTSKTSKHETTTKIVSTSVLTTKTAPTISSTKKHLAPTSKVKRKTNDPPPTTVSHKPVQNFTETTSSFTTLGTKADKLVASTEESSTTEEPPAKISTEQPESSVRIMINGTINCTAELSSLPLNETKNEAEKINLEAHPSIPYVGEIVNEKQTSNPNDVIIITDRNVNGGFDENESFTINVTTSLRTNTSHSTAAPELSPASKVPLDLSEALNITKKTKGDYDYDYMEPTLPPSLPNLKIIPFVAADAVVDDDAPPKETLTYPLLEREDKFPVYYPSVESKETQFATRREDAYHPTQYPVFVSKKVEAVKYPSLALDNDSFNAGYSSVHNDLMTSPHRHTVSALLGTRGTEFNKFVTKPPSKTTTFKLETPSVNLFSPPVETQGGFIPKGPGINSEYYAVYPSTPSGSTVPHLTTSMQLDIGKGECVSSDGRRIPEGESITVACSVCTCAWGRLQCSPRACRPAPPACARRPPPASAGDLCCGDLVCKPDNKTTATTVSTREIEESIYEQTLTENNVPTAIKSEILLFDPPPDRSVPVPNGTVVEVTTQKDASPLTDFANKHAVYRNNSGVANNGTNVNITKTTSTETSIITTTAVTTMPLPNHKEMNETKPQSDEYEDEEDDEGFSFGSVLKLLLSDSYDTSSKKPTTVTTKLPVTTTVTSPAPVSTTRRLLPNLTGTPFVPLPHHLYQPQKKVFQQNTVNRIDHLVLGEATAISRKSTPRPVTSPFRATITSFRPAVTSTRPFTNSRVTTPKPNVTKKLEVTKKEEHTDRYTSVTHEGPRLPGPGPSSPGVAGFLKLAGCNIYGRMYRVGRIIAELSTPCQECRCTELGVQCRQLAC